VTERVRGRKHRTASVVPIGVIEQREKRPALPLRADGHGQGAATRSRATVRTGVVLAAGRSQRLSGVTGGRSKMLQRLGGISLVERSVRRLLAEGLDRVIVVTGHDAKDVAHAVAPSGERVEVMVAPEWANGNGASLAAARSHLREDELFLVVCGDHVFSDGALAELAGSDSPAVLVDKAPPPDVWAEGTKVHVVDGLASRFSKALPDPWIDCGAFVLSQEIFSCYDEGAALGDHSLAGAVSRFTATVSMRVRALGPGSWWRDVDTSTDLRYARSLLRRSLGKDSDGAVSRRLNRPVSTRITMAIAPLRVAPWIVSMIAFSLGAWGAWSLSGGRALMGGVLVQVASILDGVDGETARLRGLASQRGALVDSLCDRMVDAAIVAGLWLWAWDDPSRAFRITSILASAVGWGLVAIAARGPFSVFEVPRATEPALWAAIGGRDARMLMLSLGSIANRPIVAFFVGMTTFLGSGMWRMSFVLRDRARRRTALASATRSLRLLRRSMARVGRAVLFPAVLVVMFIGVLPRLANLGEVWTILRSLSWRTGGIMLLLAGWNLVTYWPTLVAAMPGLSLRQAAIVSQSSTAVAMTVPAGGAVAVGVSYAMYSSWGFSTSQVARSAFVTFLANMAFKLLLPGISLLILFAMGEKTTGLVVATLIGVATFSVSTGTLIGVLRSDRVARRAGDVAGRLIGRIRNLTGSSPVVSWSDGMARLRVQTVSLLRERWLPLASAEIVSQSSVFLVMLASMRVLGIGGDDVGWAEALAVFAVVRLASAVPLVPGNVGLAELGYIGGLIVAGGSRAEVVASVLLFRFLTYFAQIPIGALTYLRWRYGGGQRSRLVETP
jgi:choline kinase/uncharacterized membrane protein YbhN (UPF0104 family)